MDRAIEGKESIVSVGDGRTAVFCYVDCFVGSEAERTVASRCPSATSLLFDEKFEVAALAVSATIVGEVETQGNRTARQRVFALDGSVRRLKVVVSEGRLAVLDVKRQARGTAAGGDDDAFCCFVRGGIELRLNR
jgi:hypothetical protein